MTIGTRDTGMLRKIYAFQFLNRELVLEIYRMCARLSLSSCGGILGLKAPS